MFKGKTFYSFLQMILGLTKNIFYKFNHILHIKKYLKIRKYLLLKIIQPTAWFKGKSRFYPYEQITNKLLSYAEAQIRPKPTKVSGNVW